MNNLDITAVIEGARATLAARNNLVLRGSAVVQTIDVDNNVEFYYDESLGGAGGKATLSLVR